MLEETEQGGHFPEKSLILDQFVFNPVFRGM